MPRLNAIGQAICGVGDGIVSVDTDAIHPGGIACPRDDQRVVFGGPWDGRWQLLQYDSGTDAVQPLEDRRVSFLAAGGGHYLASDAWGSGLYGSLPVPAEYTCLTPPDTDNRGAASRDGTFAVTDQSGQGFALLSADGAITERFFPGVPAYGVTVVAKGKALMPVGGEIQTVGLVKPAHIGASGRACWCEIGGRVWLVHYLIDVGLVLRVHGGAFGLVLNVHPTFFCYDAIVAGGLLFVAYSASNGERPEELVRITFDETTLNTLASQPLEIPVPNPEPEPEPDPVPEIPESIKPFIDSERAKYPEIITFEQGAQIINDATFKAGDGWGFSVKPGGNNVQLPSGIRVAYDIAQHKDSDTLWDVFKGQNEGEPFKGIVIWSQAEHHHDPNRPWLAPTPPTGHQPDPGSPGQPIPQPPGSSTGDLNAAADARAAAMLAKLLKPLEARIKALEDEPDAPAPQPFPTKVALKSDHGKYLVAEGDLSVKADRENVGAWETWTIEVQE